MCLQGATEIRSARLLVKNDLGLAYCDRGTDSSSRRFTTVRMARKSPLVFDSFPMDLASVMPAKLLL